MTLNCLIAKCRIWSNVCVKWDILPSGLLKVLDLVPSILHHLSSYETQASCIDMAVDIFQLVFFSTSLSWDKHGLWPDKYYLSSLHLVCGLKHLFILDAYVC